MTSFEALREWNVLRCERGELPVKNWAMAAWLALWQEENRKLLALLEDQDRLGYIAECDAEAVAQAARVIVMIDVLFARYGSNLAGAVRAHMT